MEFVNHTFLIQWTGPLSYTDFLRYVRNPDTACPEWFNFYCFESRQDARCKWHRYFGVHFGNDGINKRVNAGHNKIKKYKDQRDFKIWIGSLSDLKAQTEDNVDLIETLFIRAYRDILDENKRKKKRLPKESVSVINQWFDKEDTLKKYRREKPDFIDDVLLYYDEEGVFFKGATLRKMKDSD